MKYAAAYIRVSDSRQDEYSPESQLKLIKEYAMKNEFIITDSTIYYDDGISGKSAKKRTAFNAMIVDAKNRKFEAILVWKFSRFARNQEESIVYKNLLRREGVSVVSISEPIGEDAFSSLIERIIEWMDEYYLIRLGPEVRRGMTEKATRGEPMCKPPFGYISRDNQYYPHPEQAPMIKWIFEQYAAGAGQRKIALEMNNRGFRSTRGNAFDNRGIEYILNNPVYIGKLRWSPDGRAASKRDYHNSNVIIANAKHEPLISDELWQAVQERLAEVKRTYGKHQRTEQEVEWMLKGLVHCSACGTTLSIASRARHSIQCAAYAKGTCKVSHYITIPVVNKIIAEQLRNVGLTGSFEVTPSLAPDRLTDTTDYAKLITAAKRKADRARNAYLNGVFELEQLREVTTSLNAEIAEYRAKQSNAHVSTQDDAQAYQNKVLDILTFINNADNSEAAKNALLRSIITEVVFSRSASHFTIFLYC